MGQSTAIINLHHKKLFDQEALEWLSSEDIAERCRITSDIYFMDAEIFSILRKHDQPPKLAYAFSTLKEKNVPIKDYMHLLTKHKSPRGLAFGISLLFDFVPQNEATLPKECYEWLAQVEGDPASVASLYCKLHEANQLTKQNLSVVAKCENHELGDGVEILLENDLFNEETFQTAAEHPKPLSYCSALKIMKNISEEYRTFLLKHSSPDSLACIFRDLHQAGLLTPKRAKQAAQHASPNLLSGLISRLKWSKLLSAESWKEGIVHPHVYEYDQILLTIDSKKILNEETRSLVAKYPDTLKLKKAVDELGRRQKLTLESFLLIVERPDPSDALALLT